MKFTFLFALLFSISSLKAQTYNSMNVSLLSVIAPETTNNWYGTATKYAGCYGWHNPVDNKEYAILGSTKGNHFIEITNPSAPVVRDFVPGVAQNSLWREIKTYQNYAYLVSDDNGNRFQIVDMSYLPDSVHVVYQSNALFAKSHTIFVEGNKLYCGATTSSTGVVTSMAVYDLSDPENPVLLRKLNQDLPSIGYVHDMFVRNDTIYASTGNPGLFILKFNSNNTFSLLADYTNYVDVGYNHSSYLTPDSKTLVFTDEVATGLAVKVIDVTDLGNITLKDTIKSHIGATAHNPYVTDDYHAIISYYQDGIQIYDVSNPNNAVLTGFFDTDYLHGDNDNYTFSTAYRGCWGAYPYLPSGVLIASDMQNGLFVLDMSSALGVKSSSTLNYLNIYPNPTTDELNIVISSEKNAVIQMEIIDLMGRVIMKVDINKTEKLLQHKINTSLLASGSYIIKLNGGETNTTQKFIKAD
ncbi:MAG: choice-of-anchor B family protein [Bacteroidetes bacterium]|nr:choice-of-anchor B family protein [Bacteroidota bacterium]